MQSEQTRCQGCRYLANVQGGQAHQGIGHHAREGHEQGIEQVEKGCIVTVQGLLQE